MRNAIVYLFVLACGAAQAAPDCQFVLRENQRHARTVFQLMRTYSEAMGWVRNMEDHADRFFIDPKQNWRGTVALGGGVVTAPRQDCRAGRTWSAQPGAVNASFIAGVGYRPLGLKLRVFGVGRRDALSFSAKSVEALPTDELYRLTYGVNLEVTQWASIGVIRTARTGEPIGAQTLRVTFPDATPPWLMELGIPRLGLFAILDPNGEQTLFQRVSVEDVPITDRLTATARLERSPTEERWLIGPAARFSVIKRSGPSLDISADLRLENAPANLRHARVAAIVPLLKTGFKRRMLSGAIGGHIEQGVSLSVHRGAELRRVSGQSAAVGAAWETLMRMQSHVFYIDVVLKLGINNPELLDLFPGAVNGFNMLATMRWGGHF